MSRLAADGAANSVDLEHPSPSWALLPRDPECFSHPWCLFFDRTAGQCVRCSRAGRLKAQTAVLPHLRDEARSHPHYQDWDSSGRCAVLPPCFNALVYRCLLKSPRGASASS